jgi:hypothetical protein
MQAACGLGNARGDRLRIAPDPIVKRIADGDKIGAGFDQCLDFIGAGGKGDAGRFEYFSPPGDALLDGLEGRPFAAPNIT